MKKVVNKQKTLCEEPGKKVPMKQPIFVYGTLMRGERASYMLDDYEYCGTFCLKDYAMYNVSTYPGIKSKKGECVVGEVYLVDDACIQRMDEYEEEGSLYIRKLVNVENASGNMEAFVYVYNHESIGPVIHSKWNVKPDSEIWYARCESNRNFDSKEEVDKTSMRLQKITWKQLLDLQEQESLSPNWSGRSVCLGIHEDGCPIYTISCFANSEQLR